MITVQSSNCACVACSRTHWVCDWHLGLIAWLMLDVTPTSWLRCLGKFSVIVASDSASTGWLACCKVQFVHAPVPHRCVICMMYDKMAHENLSSIAFEKDGLCSAPFTQLYALLVWQYAPGTSCQVSQTLLDQPLTYYVLLHPVHPAHHATSHRAANHDRPGTTCATSRRSSRSEARQGQPLGHYCCTRRTAASHSGSRFVDKFQPTGCKSKRSRPTVVVSSCF